MARRRARLSLSGGRRGQSEANTGEEAMRRLSSTRSIGFALLLCLLGLPSRPALTQTRADMKDMALVGSSDLQARSAYQPIIHQQGGRWIAYIGHHGGNKEVPKPRNAPTGADEINGPSPAEGTDPGPPRALRHMRIEYGLAR